MMEEIGDKNIKKENVCDIEALLHEERHLINEEKDTPDYVNVNLFSDVKPKVVAVESFQCTECTVIFKEYAHLSIHMAVHSSDVVCPHCNVRFSSKYKLRKHISYIICKMTAQNKNLTYDCPYCSKSFKIKKSYTIHLRVHTNERPYKCGICAEGFKQLGALKDHHVTHTKERRYTCEICNGAYTTSSSLNRHKKRIHDRNRSIDCKRCNVKFYNKADFNAHVDEAHPQRNCRVCPTCSEEFHSYFSLAKHKQKHPDHFFKNEKPAAHRFRCKLCGEETDSIILYSEHRTQHLNYTNDELKEAAKSKTYRCKFCAVVYKYKRNLMRHIDQHVGKVVQCDICGSNTTILGLKAHKMRVHRMITCHICAKVMFGQSKLIYHYKKHHSKQAKDYACSLCGKKFVLKKLLVYHVRLKHKTVQIKNKKCNICGQRLTSQVSLMRHKKTLHKFRVKLKCLVCEKSFETLKEIVAHNLTHKSTDLTEKKLVTKCFRCKVCKKIFLSRVNYRQHVVSRSCVSFVADQRRLCYCEVCDARFSSVRYLQRHLQMHSNFEYQCQFCDKKSKMIEKIQVHMRKCHPGKEVFWCDGCGERFDVSADYEAHRNSHVMKKETLKNAEECEDSGIGNRSVIKIKNEVIEN